MTGYVSLIIHFPREKERERERKEPDKLSKCFEEVETFIATENKPKQKIYTPNFVTQDWFSKAAMP